MTDMPPDMAVERPGPRPRVWTDERKEHLRATIDMPAKDVAAELGMTTKAILAQRSKLGLAGQPKDSWTEERTERFRQLWADGYSAGYIANDLGGISRSAVAGKRMRLGLAARETLTSLKGSNLPKTVKRLREDEHLDIDAPPQAIGDDQIPLDQRRTLLQLTPGTCRWPVGDVGTDAFFFCGAVPRTDRPYCARHARLAYAKTPPPHREVLPPPRWAKV